MKCLSVNLVPFHKVLNSVCILHLNNKFTFNAVCFPKCQCHIQAS